MKQMKDGRHSEVEKLNVPEIQSYTLKTKLSRRIIRQLPMVKSLWPSCSREKKSCLLLRFYIKTLQIVRILHIVSCKVSFCYYIYI